MLPLRVGGQSFSAIPQMPQQPINVPTVQTREEVLGYFEEYKDSAKWHQLLKAPIEIRKAYQQAEALLDHVRDQNFFTQAEIDQMLAEIYREFSFFERNQGEGEEADRLVRKAMSLSEQRPHTQKRELARDSSAEFHFSKKTAGNFLDRPQSVQLNPEFENLTIDTGSTQQSSITQTIERGLVQFENPVQKLVTGVGELEKVSSKSNSNDIGELKTTYLNCFKHQQEMDPHSKQQPLAILGKTASMALQQPVASPAQDKIAQVDYLFEKALSTLGSLELSNKTSLFLVYAHDNPAYGKADADTSKYLIEKLSQIRINLYSDQTPMGQMHSIASEALKEDGKLEDILTSQFCLLPTQLRKEVEPVDKVVVCCSEVLEKYLKEWPHYEIFYQQLRVAYHQDCEQKSTSAIREVVKRFSQEPKYKAGFHHVLTEMAFLQIRAEHQKDQHGIIPISLTPKSAKQCLGHFIPQTTVRMEDIPRFEAQAQAGQEVHPNQNRHLVLFKLIERLLVSSGEAKTFLNKFWQGYDKCISQLKSEPSMVDGLEFVKLVDGIFGDIEKELRSQLVLILQHKRKVKELHLPKLPRLREALYQHYQRSNLSIQRVSGDRVSLADCYINLAIVESQAQRDKDKKELEKQAATFQRLPSGERLEAANSNKLIALEKLFEVQKLRNGSEGIPKRILIQGRAGIGKTTLCKKLVYEYHQNGLWQDRFESVLWVPLRRLKTHSPKRLEDLLCNQYFVGHESSQAQALSKVLHAHQGKTLFILDGLDEVASELGGESSLGNFLRVLLEKEHIVITSRPTGVDTNMLNKLDLELETVGFSQDNVQAYIQKFALESQKAAIGQFIKETPFIQGLVNIPIQLDALCYSWKNLPQNQTMTMASLYQAMVDKLWRKDSVRLEKKEEGQLLGPHEIEDLSESELQDVMAAEIDYLSYLAFKGLEAEQIEFSLQELSQRKSELNKISPIGRKLPINFTTNLKKTSYLHTADTTRPERERHYHFLHLTFQEFFAAKFLVRHLEKYAETEETSASTKNASIGLGVMPNQTELEAFIATHKYNPRYEIVWWMVAGLLQKSAVLEKFFTRLGEAPRDLIGGRHQQVMMGCLNEARRQLNPKTVLELEKELMQWVHFELDYIGEFSSSGLGRQGTFPEHLLLILLEQPKSKKREIINTLSMRPTLSEVAVLALLKALKDEEDNWVREGAAKALIGQKMLPEATISELIGVLKKDQEAFFVKKVVIETLGAQEILSETAISALIDFLKGNGYKKEVINALGKQKILPETVVSSLIEALEDDDVFSDVKEAVVAILGKQKMLPKAAVSALIEALSSGYEEVREMAAEIVGKQKIPLNATVSALIEALKDEDWGVRFSAARTLGKQKVPSEAAVSALIEALKDEDEDVRSAATWALGNLNMLPEVAVSALLEALRNEDWLVRFEAAKSLGKQKILSEAAVSVLIEALKDEDFQVRKEAANALGRQKGLSKTVVSALIEVLKDEDEEEDVQWAAAAALGKQKILSETAFLPVIEAFNDTANNQWVFGFHSGMEYMHSETTELELVKDLKGEDEWDCLDAIEAYEQQMLSKTTVSTLIGILVNRNSSIKAAAAKALGEFKMLSETAVLALIEALEDENEDHFVKYMAANTLGCQNGLSADAVQALIFSLRDNDQYVRSEAANALARQNGLLLDDAVHVLISFLKDENEAVRSSAATALGRQRTLSSDAVSALISTLGDEKEVVRSRAATALGAHFDQHYRMLPSLSPEQIEALYTRVLFPRSCEQIATLYIQDRRHLHFYAATGPGQPIELTSEQIVKMVRTLGVARAKAGIAPLLEEEALLMEE